MPRYYPVVPQEGCVCIPGTMMPMDRSAEMTVFWHQQVTMETPELVPYLIHSVHTQPVVAPEFQSWVYPKKFAGGPGRGDCDHGLGRNFFWNVPIKLGDLGILRTQCAVASAPNPTKPKQTGDLEV